MLTLPPLAGTIEYAISEDRMTEEGELWEPEEDDPTLDRCTFYPRPCIIM